MSLFWAIGYVILVACNLTLYCYLDRANRRFERAARAYHDLAERYLRVNRELYRERRRKTTPWN